MTKSKKDPTSPPPAWPFEDWQLAFIDHHKHTRLYAWQRRKAYFDCCSSTAFRAGWVAGIRAVRVLLEDAGMVADV